MSAEFGATATLCPVDEQALRYLRTTGRDPQLVDLVERYTKAQGLFRTDAAPEAQFDDLLELDLSTIEPSLAGPRRPQDRVPMHALRSVFRTVYADRFTKEEDATAQVAIGRMLEEGDRIDTASALQEGAQKTP